MRHPSQNEDRPRFSLDRISTQWSMINDPMQFVIRYSPAIRSYIDALIKNQHDAEEVTQDFILRVVQSGFARATPDRGRFRDYLKTAVRNAALTRLRRKREAMVGDFNQMGLGTEDETPQRLDEEWLSQWRRCVLNRAWRRLEAHERSSPNNLFFSVLRTSADHPEEDSRAQAARVSAKVNRPLASEAYRKQLSRARRMFAELLLEEVVQTLDSPTPEQVEEELIDVGLMDYIRDFLPPDWRTRGELTEGE